MRERLRLFSAPSWNFSHRKVNTDVPCHSHIGVNYAYKQVRCWLPRWDLKISCVRSDAAPRPATLSCVSIGSMYYRVRLDPNVIDVIASKSWSPVLYLNMKHRRKFEPQTETLQGSTEELRRECKDWIVIVTMHLIRSFASRLVYTNVVLRCWTIVRVYCYISHPAAGGIRFSCKVQARAISLTLNSIAK